MKLQKYNEKRKFPATPEPKGKLSRSENKNRFVVQMHAARHLHYDFRLEMNGVLKSWAVPKGPSLDPHVKRLAVQVEDHPIEYGDFEGIIPKGNYGAGGVMIWDKGTWKIDSKDKKTSSISFTLNGKKLKGKWKLIQIKSDPKNWLLIKATDKEAVPQDEYNVLEEDCSVISGKNMGEIADGNFSDLRKETKKKKTIKIDELNVKKKKLPTKIKPQLATLVDAPPSSKEWLHEMKFDGYRLLCAIKNKAKLITRGEQDWTHRFKEIAKEVEKLDLKDSILDGEVVALDKKGLPNFQLLQNVLNNKEKVELVYYVFDIIFYKGHDISTLPLLERKKILESILPKKNAIIRYSSHIQGNGSEVYDHACQLGFEGIMSKNIHSEYVQKRSKSWVKVKCSQRQEFVIVGFTKPKGDRNYFGSLLLGYYDGNKKLTYCGRVGTGFNDKSLKEMHKLLTAQKTTRSPFKEHFRVIDLLSWVKPNIVIDVEFTEWTNDGILRHPSFKGLRMDKGARKVTREEKKTIKKEKEEKFKYNITHPERVVYPKDNITKLDIAKYYYAVHDWILPYLVNRPLAIVRCPQGLTRSCFFQKHVTSKIKGVYSGDNYLYVKNLEGLMQLVQQSTLEFHYWGSQVGSIEKPDLITFDLDPGTNVEWEKVVEAAFRIKKELENMELESFVKTTGGKGLHVVVPIQKRFGWIDVENFSKTFALYMVKKYPGDYIEVMTKAKRVGKIFIDYLRNGRGSSAIVPYSTRARVGATVATPLSWEELTTSLDPNDFTIHSVEERLNEIADPWQDFFNLKQKLPRHH